MQGFFQQGCCCQFLQISYCLYGTMSRSPFEAGWLCWFRSCFEDWVFIQFLLLEHGEVLWSFSFLFLRLWYGFKQGCGLVLFYFLNYWDLFLCFFCRWVTTWDYPWNLFWSLGFLVATIRWANDRLRFLSIGCWASRVLKLINSQALRRFYLLNFCFNRISVW